MSCNRSLQLLQEVTSVNTIAPDFPYVTICNQFAPSQSRADAMLTDPTSSLAEYVQLIGDNHATFRAFESETGDYRFNALHRVRLH